MRPYISCYSDGILESSTLLNQPYRVDVVFWGIKLLKKYPCLLLYDLAAHVAIEQ